MTIYFKKYPPLQPQEVDPDRSGQRSKNTNINLKLKIMKNSKLIGKYQVKFLPKNDGIEICTIELIDKFTEIYESSEGRFSLKVYIFDTINDVVNFIYQEKKYISIEDATEIFYELLESY